LLKLKKKKKQFIGVGQSRREVIIHILVTLYFGTLVKFFETHF